VLCWLAGIAIGIPLLVLAGYGLAPSILTVTSNARTADVIIILGGETPKRAARGAELFRQGAAKRILVTGEGDAPIIRRHLIRAGVPAEAILIEEQSVTTQENAVLTAPILRRLQVRKALLVTSWFHTRRAWACFHHYAPDVEFHCVPSEYSWAAYRSPRLARFVGLYREYGKLAGYWLRHGIPPFVGSAQWGCDVRLQSRSVIFVNRVYPPGRGATGELLAELARASAQCSWPVTGIGSPSAKPRAPGSELQRRPPSGAEAYQPHTGNQDAPGRLRLRSGGLTRLQRGR